jgi:hypothetical protein
MRARIVEGCIVLFFLPLSLLHFLAKGVGDLCLQSGVLRMENPAFVTRVHRFGCLLATARVHISSIVFQLLHVNSLLLSPPPPTSEHTFINARIVTYKTDIAV